MIIHKQHCFIQTSKLHFCKTIAKLNTTIRSDRNYIWHVMSQPWFPSDPFVVSVSQFILSLDCLPHHCQFLQVTVSIYYRRAPSNYVWQMARWHTHIHTIGVLTRLAASYHTSGHACSVATAHTKLVMGQPCLLPQWCLMDGVVCRLQIADKRETTIHRST